MREVNLGPASRLGTWCVVLAAAVVLAGCGNSNGAALEPTCGTGEVACGSGSAAYCANLQNDNANCGSCGSACPTGQACTNGTCAASCGTGMTKCGTGQAAYCANLDSDNANCGACGTVCPAGEACTGGACAVTCGGGLTECGTGGTAFCANLQSDNLDCGSCGNACPAGTVCAGGTCGVTCSPPMAACPSANGKTCVDLKTDDHNCGSCGATCVASTACVNGTCCTATTWFQDADGDGFGNPAVTKTACPQPDGYVADNTDCDDTNPNVYPGATEICDGVQDDCANTAWTSDAGLATFMDGTGAITDWSSKLAAGTQATPVTIALDTEGTLNVCGGTWYAGFTVGANVAIVGHGGRDAVILDGGDQQRVVTSPSGGTAYALELSGVTLAHGKSTANGGAMRLLNAGQVKLTDVAVTASTAVNGGGIYALSPLDLERVSISGNTAVDSGGGLLTVGAVTADWLQITGNQATAAQGGNGYGGGWVIDDTAPVTLTVSNLSVDRNTALQGGGILVRGLNSAPPTLTVTGGEISGNSAVRRGGGLWMSQGDVTLTGLTMVGNRADTGNLAVTLAIFGGAANVSAGTLTLNGCTVQDNVDEYGTPPGVGGIWTKGTLKVTDSHFGYNCIWLLSTHVCVTPSSNLTAADVVSGTSNNAYVLSDPANVTCDAQSCQ